MSMSPRVTSSPSQSPTNRKRIDGLFLKFAAYYGSVWRSQFKQADFLEFAKWEWTKALREFEDKVIEQATIASLASKEFPPTLPQFIDLCRAAKKRLSFIPPKRCNKPRNLELAYTQLKKMKQILNIKP
ncbi:TPA: Vir protein [Legionella anisa]